MKRICIITARGGSRRIPRKNIREFRGKPIIAYSIETALACDSLDAVYVSTDDEEIGHVAVRHGAEVLVRPSEMARDEVGTREVMADAILGGLEAGIGHPQYLYVCLYPCAPLFTVGDLLYVMSLAEYRGGYCMAVGADPLRDAGTCYAGFGYLWTSMPMVSHLTSLYVLPDERVCDINTEADWKDAEHKYDLLKRQVH